MSLAGLAAGVNGLVGRVSLSWRIVVVAGLVGMAGTAGLVYAVVDTIQSFEQERATRALDANLKLLRNLVLPNGGEIRLDGDKLIAVRKGSPDLPARDVVLNGRLDVVDRVKETLGGVATIFLADTRVATNVQKPDGTRGVGTKLAPGPAYDTVLVKGETYRGVADILGQPHLTIYEPIKDASGKVIGILFVGLPQSEFQGTLGALVGRVGVITVVALGVAAVFMYLAINWQLKPLTRIRRMIEAVARGEVAAESGLSQRRDEIGEMARAVDVFRDGIVERERLAEAQEAERAAKERRANALDTLIKGFEERAAKVVDSVSSAAGALENMAKTMGATAEQATAQTSSVAATSVHAAQNVHTVAAATEELSTSIADIAERIRTSTAMISKAVDEAHATNSQVAFLAQAAQNIGDVVKLISDIAAQTNLLALNATIEAARAGEAGKGFAVVAAEVKQLATQTAKATEEIGNQIGSIQTATHQSIAAIKGITETIAEVNTIASEIAGAIAEQGRATQEIASNVTEASRSTEQVNGDITGVSQAVRRSGEAATEVLDAARALSRSGAELKNEIDGFLREVRAA